MPFTPTRRTFLSLPLAAALSWPSILAAQTPAASPITKDLARFQADADALLTSGREVVEAFLAADDATFSAAMAHPDLAALSATDELAWLQTNRVRIRWSDLPLLLDGHFDGSGTMAGYAWQTGGPTTFVLTADADQAQPYPTGRWVGVLAPDIADLPVVLNFEGDAEVLAVTLDVPDQDLSGIAANTASFLPELPISDRVQDVALPMGETNLLYRAEYVWGDALLGFDLVAAPEGGFIGFGTVLRDLLPADPALNLEPAASYRLPAAEPLFVYWGGPTEFQNYHAATPAQRHALDLVVWADGSTYRTDGMRNDDYLIWGTEVQAPAGGTVVALLNDQPDIPPAIAQAELTPSASPVAETGPGHPAGNHVVLEVAPGTYVFLAHLQQGSVTLNVGDAVAAGAGVGLAGNSGNTSEPHIHLHAQTIADLFDPAAIGLPLTFDAFLADGQAVTSASPVQGQFVEQP